MAKGKSSASSATRKKHAKKAAGKQGDEEDAGGPSQQQQPKQKGLQRGQKKLKKDRFAPKVKSYVPPPPPPKGAPDPIDLYLQGGKQIDAELLVILKRFMKKDESTLEKGIEALQEWTQSINLEQTAPEEERWSWEIKRDELVQVMAVWAHHFDKLASHVSRRLRLSTAQLHAVLTSRSAETTKETRAALLAPLWIEQTQYIGAWACSAFDIDRTVKQYASKTWQSVTSAGDDQINLVEHAPSILKHAETVLLSQEASTLDLSHIQVPALSVISYLLQNLPSPLPESIEAGFLRSEELWQLLSCDSGPVRKAAYELLERLCERKDEDLIDQEDGLAHVSQAVLSTCWKADTDWPSVVVFLRKYPQAWVLADKQGGGSQDSDSGSEDGEEDDGEEQQEQSTQRAFEPNTPLRALLAFLRDACAGNSASYDVVVLLVSTIPPQVLPRDRRESIDVVLDSLWAGKDSRTLAPARARSQFFSSFCDTVAFLNAKLREADPTAADKLVSDWAGRLWTYATSPQLNLLPADFDKYAGTLARLAKDDQSTLVAIESQASAELGRRLNEGATDLLPKLESIIGSLRNEALPTIVREHAGRLSTALVEEVLQALERPSEPNEQMIAMLTFLTSTSPSLDDQQQIARIDALSEKQLPRAILASTAGSTAVLQERIRTNPNSASPLWTQLFQPIPPVETLLPLYDVASTEGMSSHLPPVNLDETVSIMAAKVLSDEGGSAQEEQLLQKIMAGPPVLVTADMPFDLINLVMHRLEKLVREALFSGIAVLDSFRVPVVMLDSFTRSDERCAHVAQQVDWADAAFALGHHLALPRFGLAGTPVCSKARHIWDRLRAVGGDSLEAGMISRHSKHLLDCNYGLTAPELVDTASSFTASSTASLISPEELRRLVDNLATRSIPPQLVIIDPLCSTSSDDESEVSQQYDSDGLSSSSRAIVALLEVAAREPNLIRSRLDHVRPLLLSRCLAQDQQNDPSFKSGLVEPRPPFHAILARLQNSIEGMLSFLVSSATRDLSESWHNETVSRLRNAKAGDTASAADLSGVLEDLYTDSTLSEAYRARAFSHLLRRVLQYSDREEDALRWLALAQSLPPGQDLLAFPLTKFTKAMVAASWRTNAIVFATKDLLLENPRLQRWQNELASMAAGVSPAQANDKGLSLLQTLIATAPPIDAPVIFLPQQRCIFLIQKVQTWLASDEELDDSVHTVLAELFFHVAPIIQDMSGSHWELMFDIIDSNLDVAAWDDADSLPALYHSCMLLRQLTVLASTNRELRSTVTPLADKSIAQVRKLLISRPKTTVSSRPLQLISDVMLELMRSMPSKTTKADASMNELLPLLRDPALTVKKAFFNLACEWIQQSVDDLVIEAELDTEGKMEIAIPSTLIELLPRPPQDADIGTKLQYLLAWLLVFEHFVKASPRIKSSYLEQLRNSELVTKALLPALFDITGIAGRKRIVDLSCFSIDDFDVALLDEDLDETVIAILAAAVYFRTLQSVPSLVREWLDGCRDKQLTMAVTSQTSRFFSPVLIESELAHLRDPDDATSKTLRDNPDFTVKVAAGANEVKAVFVVDEQNMEIGIRLPSEYPLQVVEVKDVRKVGVTDAQWRAWILAVQQVITTQNGLIAEALSLFKRNVTLHFEGVEACAICYSVISVVDRTLPTKACRVCHNKFHPGCLYKWFMTSHGSSCPLCRSLF